jgi:phosphoglycolate phosphatase
VTGRRLHLFDIDGTLISTGGAGGKAMALAFAAIWKRDDGFVGIEFSGRTDRAILKDALLKAACSDREFDDDLRRFKRAYYRRLAQTLPVTSGRLLDGVSEVLAALSQDASSTVGLATGNFRYSAAMKLTHYGIWQHFITGGFGDQVEDRAEMVGQAMRSADRLVGRHDTVFVIGDTVHDIASAKAHGVVAVGVTTGAATEEELSRAGADVVLPSLMDAAQQLSARSFWNGGKP